MQLRTLSTFLFLCAVVTAVAFGVESVVIVIAIAPRHCPTILSCAGDVDIFLIAPKAGDEQAVLGKVYDTTMAACQHLRGDNARLLVTRSRSAVTLFKGDKGAPLQVILNTYSSVEELLFSFDVDCACCAYVIGTGQFVCSARGRRALEYRLNVIQSTHHSLAYISRLEKYATRGSFVFRLAVSLCLLLLSLLRDIIIYGTNL
jgi:hypothetical protein